MAMPVALTALDELREHIGSEVAVSDWFLISQESIDKFAEATGDDQWIHVDAGRAARESPYHVTIAHGFLTLSLIGTLLRGVVALDGVRMSVNYGSDRVRFITPVLVGTRIRGRFTVARVEERGDAVKVVWNVTIERQPDLKPCCVAEWIVLYYR